MAPRRTAQTATAPAAPAPTAVASNVTKTVSGFAIGLTAFIPVDPKDLRKQAEIPLLLLDIQEGKKTIADLAPYLRQTEFRQQHTRKRVSEAEYDDLFDLKKPETEQQETEFDDEDEAGGDIGSVDGEGYSEDGPTTEKEADGDEE